MATVLSAPVVRDASSERRTATLASPSFVLFLALFASLAGNRWAGRTSPDRARRSMNQGSIAAAVAVALTWSFTGSLAVTLVLFAIASVVTAARTVAGTVYGFTVADDLGREVGAIRVATTQIGYLIGSLLGGMAIAFGGLGMLSLVYAPLFLAATLPYICLRKPCRLENAPGTAR